MNDERRQSWESAKTTIWNDFLDMIVRILKKLFCRISDEAERIIDCWSFNPA